MKVTLSHPCSAGDGKQKFLVFSTSPINPVPESPKFVKSTNVTRRDGRNLCNPQPVWERVVRGEDTPRSGGQGEGNEDGAARPPPCAKSLRQHRCIVLIPPLRGAGGAHLPGTPGTTPVPTDPAAPRDPRQFPEARTDSVRPSAGPHSRDPPQVAGVGTPGSSGPSGPPTSSRDSPQTPGVDPSAAPGSPDRSRDPPAPLRSRDP